MNETLKILLSIIGGATGAAIVNALYNRWRFKAERKAKKEDKAEEKRDKTDELQRDFESLTKQLKDMDRELSAQSEALKLILLDRIMNLGTKYVQAGEITLDDRTRFHAMYNCYHCGLHGNGDADLIVAAVDELPLKMR